MKATVWIVLTAAPVLWATAAGATDRVTIQTGRNMTTAPFEPAAGVQLAADGSRVSETSAEKRRLQASDHDVDLDQYPTESHRTLMPGQKSGSNATSPGGYDAKRLNRLWGRFNGAKPNAKAAKPHKSNGEESAVRRPAGGHVGTTTAHTLKRKWMMSPSWTTYSLPSRRSLPCSRHLASLP